MNEELHLQPVAQRSLVQSAVIVTVATLIGHFIPIVPFIVVERDTNGSHRPWCGGAGFFDRTLVPNSWRLN